MPGIGAAVADEAHPQPGERAVACGSRARRTGSGRGCAGATTRSSLRVGDHVTGRSRWRAAAATAEYSAQMPALPPNPPPTCGAMTWMSRARPCRARRRAAVQAVGHLGRGVERQPAVVAGHGGAAVGLHRHDGHALVDVAAAHDDVADGRRGRPGRHRWRRGPGWSRGPGRSPARRRRTPSSGSMIAGERLVVGPDGGGAVGGRGHGLGDDDGDRPRRRSGRRRRPAADGRSRGARSRSRGAARRRGRRRCRRRRRRAATASSMCTVAEPGVGQLGAGEHGVQLARAGRGR